MAFLTLEGIYRNGQLELEDPPADSPTEARVLVTFLSPVEGAAVRETAREAAVERLVARMQAGIDFGGVKFNREELYAERLRELDERRESNGGHEHPRVRP